MPAFSIVVMGTARFAVPTLDILLKNGYAIPAVVTVPDKPRGRGQEVLPSPVKVRAAEAGLTVLQPARLADPAFAAQIIALSPDLIVVVAFRILPRSIFTIPRCGSINLHASLLPRYRGAAPINRAIMNGDRETGVTTFFLDDAVDTGNILLQERLLIGDDDDAGTVHDRLDDIGAELVLRTVGQIARGEAAPQRQDPSEVSPAPKIFKEDCRIRWEGNPVTVRNMVRGLAPVPTAFTTYKGKVVKIFRTVAGERILAAGILAVESDRLVVGTGEGSLEILELQLEGKKRMPAADFLRGTHIVTGDSFV
jgi:methionyl-tRNA formyltransferase